MALPSVKKVSDVYDMLKPRPTVPVTTYVNNLWDLSNQAAQDFLTQERGFNDKTIKYFQIGVNEAGDIAIPVFKDEELANYKFRGIKEKKFYNVRGCEAWIVNQDGLVAAAREKYLIIVEGEFDCMAVWQLGFDNVISTTGGAQEKGAEWIARIPEEVQRIYINYDNDEPGKEAARTLAERIGIEKCYNVLLPQKDANDFTRNGGTLEEYKRILKNAPRFDIEGVKQIGDVLEEIQNNKIERRTTNIDRVNMFTKGGIPKSSLVIMSGRTGVGKSTLLMNFLVHHAYKEKRPCLLVSLENDIQFTLKRILEIMYGKPITQFDQTTWDKAKIELPDMPLYIDVSMNTTTFEKLETIVSQAKQLYGIEFLGFDHIHFLLEGKYNITQEIGQMTKDFKLLSGKKDIIIYLVSHIRKMKEDNKYVTGEDLKDSSALQQLADLVFILMDMKEGMILSIDKARMSRSHLSIPVLHNGESGVIKDDMSRHVKSYDSIVPDEMPANTKVEVLEDVDEGYIE